MQASDDALLFDSIVYDAACSHDNDRLVQALTTHPHLIDTANPFAWGRQTPMLVAAASGNIIAVETLFRFGSKAIDVPDVHGWTAVHLAPGHGKASVLAMLLRLGSQAINTPNDVGTTPIMSAVVHGRTASGC